MMLAKTLDTPALLAQYLRGTEIARGVAGAGSIADATFVDATPDAFASVVEGQTIYIDGEGTFTLNSVTDDNTVELSAVLARTISGKHWRVCSNPIAMDKIVYAGPDSSENNKQILVWDSVNFKNV